MRLNVLKTYKLFIGGKFPRPESGRVLTVVEAVDGGHLAHYAHGSKKDLRDAVSAARGALGGWAGSSAYLKGQILYRLAEMVEGRAEALAAELVAGTGCARAAAVAEVAAAVDRLVYVAGWTDKLSQVFGSVNPVAGPFFNFSAFEGTGVVVAFAPDQPSLLGAVTLLGNALAVGNSVVLVASEKFPLSAMSLAEAVATSDVPGGVVNILTGKRAELVSAAAEHRDVDAVVDGMGVAEWTRILQAGSGTNMKRVTVLPSGLDWRDNDAAAGPYRLLELVETRTTWHPVGA